tara:strand:- start:1938 stop:3623 length:1686 start_codon:yes stop_codon:yes gene_type:complete
MLNSNNYKAFNTAIKDNIINYNNFRKKDIFKDFKGISSVQEAWVKSIEVKKKGYLVPESNHNLKKYLIKFKTLFDNKNTITTYTNYGCNFLICDANENYIGSLELCYIPKNNTIIINKIYIDHTVSSLTLLCEALKTILVYLEKNNFIEKYEVYLESVQNNLINFFKKAGFIKSKKTSNKDKFIQYDWIFSKKNIGKNLILTAGPSISEKEIYYSFDAVKEGWNSKFNYYISKLEEKFAKYIGVKYAIATSSCTGALHIAMTSLGIKENDEVIVPDVSWVATAKAVSYVNAKPVFADIEKDTWNIDIKSIEGLINKKTKAIIPVHMYGQPANILEIKKLAKKKSIYVVEDAAPAIGSRINNIKCGSIGDFSAFSFQGAKLLVAGEGGMLCTNNLTLYKKAKKIADQGRNSNYTFWIDGPGLKYKMSNIQAAIALGQLERADELIFKKRRIFNWYKKFLNINKNFILQEEKKDSYSNYWMNNILITTKTYSRALLIKHLKENNIDSRPVFSPISQYPIWKEKVTAQTVATYVGSNAINLPSGVYLSKEEVKYISKIINKFFE